MSELLRQAQLAEDRSLIARCAAAAARAGVEQPGEWAQRNAWTLAVTPGWESVRVEGDISDAAVVAAVARLIGGAPEPKPEPEPIIPEPDGDPDDFPAPDTPSSTE